MSQDLIKSLRPLFPGRVRRKAERLAATGDLVLDEVDAGEVWAQLAGNAFQSIELSVSPENESWSSSCFCDTHARGAHCEHVWAAVLLADRDEPEIFQPWLSRRRRGESAARGAPAARARPAPPAPKPAWKKKLELLSQYRIYSKPPDPWPRVESPDWEIRYVLDLDELANHDALKIFAEERKRKSNGDWGDWKQRKGRQREALARVGAEDSRLLERMQDLDRYAGGWSLPQEFGPFMMQVSVGAKLLPQLCEGKKLWWRSARMGGGAVIERGPLDWQEGDPWRPAFALTRDAQGGLSLSCHFVKADAVMPLDVPTLVHPDGLLVLEHGIAAFDHQGAGGLVVLMRGERELSVPAGEEAVLLEELSWQVGDAGLKCDVKGLLAPGEPKPHVQVLSASESEGPALSCLIAFRYGRAPRVSPGMQQRFVFDEGGERVLSRDRAAESAALETFLRLGGRHVESDQGRGRDGSVTAAGLPKLVEGLLHEGWSVEAEGLRYRTHTSSSMSVSSGIDWFDLKCEADFEGLLLPLPQLLLAASEGRNMVQLGDGSMGLLPAEWLRKVATLGALAEEKDGKLRFRRSQGALLDALLAMQDEVEVDERFDEMRARLASFSGVSSRREPRGFRGELRPYQREGLGWLEFLREQGFGGCLADDMGLGKTVQVLAMLEALRQQDGESGPSLLVVPRSLIFNWLSEASRFTPKLKVLDYSGTQRKTLKGDIAASDLVLVTYGIVTRDIEDLREIPFRHVILDESQAIKNARSQAAKAVRLLQAQHRLALTGTPIENHLGELWSLFEFLNPGMLGRSAAFQALSTARLDADLDEERRGLLGAALRPFLLRRTKEQVLPDLPEKTEQVLHCELLGRQRKDYDRVRKHYRAEFLAGPDESPGGGKFGLLAALLRLRQLACHPGLLDSGRGEELGAKLEVLLPKLRELISEGHSALVFSQFTSFLSILRKRLDAEGICYEYLDGKTTHRQDRVERFQSDPDCPLFLISLKAGGSGLNLTKADYVFMLDPWWNPATESQAIDRTHRIGQSRPVTAYRLIARDTIEERVLELQASKRALVDAVLGGGDGSLLRDLTREDLDQLLA